jgi:two-component system sensor histidine kinase KdpD
MNVEVVVDHTRDVSIETQACPRVGALPRVEEQPRRRFSRSGELVLTLGVIGVCTAGAIALRPYVAATNLVMVYLLGVVAVALYCSRRAAIFASFGSVAAFDFFCIPPYHTLRVDDYEYLLTFGAMLIVAIVISTQTARIRKQAVDAALQATRSEMLYRLSHQLAGQTQVFNAAQIAADYATEVFQCRSVIFLAEDGRISFARRTSEHLPVSTEEQPVAQWVFEHGKKAGYGTAAHRDAKALYIPLTAPGSRVGVMAVLPDSTWALTSEQEQLLDVLAHQTAAALDSMRSQHAAEDARLQMEKEQMRSSLLSAVSHDLRTPLASITGAASSLRSQREKLSPETRDDLLESIGDEAERLSRLVSNLLDMTRLQSGVELRRDLYPLEELVGSALQRLEPQLSGRQVTVDLPDNLPFVSVDDVLIGQLLVNIIENATKYSAAGTPIEVAAQASSDAVTLEVRDRGSGFAPEDEQRIFEKFYRGRSDSARGAGLGLAICRAIVEAHGGHISAFNRMDGGAVFRIVLPLESQQ